MKEAGLTTITFSVDGVHQEYIPFEDVRNGIEAAVDVGFEKVWVDSYFLGSEDSDSFHNRLTKKALEALEAISNIEINQRRVDFKGRGAELLSKELAPTQQTPAGKCPLPFCIGGTRENPDVVEIDYEGNATLCPGICIGNMRRKLLARILQEYDCNTHPILSIIVEEGPKGLLDVAKTKSPRPKGQFVDECRL